MPNCPQCRREVASPSMFHWKAWARLRCRACESRLKLKAPRSLAFAPLVLSLPVLGMQGPRFAGLAIVLMLVVNAVILLDFVRPQLRLQKPLAKPQIGLALSASGD